MSFQSTKISISTLALGVALCSSPAFAQENTDDTQGDNIDDKNIIIVEATRRAENVQDVPIAIDVLTPKAIEANGIQSIVDVPQLSSGFSLNGGGGGIQPYIRGIGSTVAGTGNYASVATYIDGAYIARGTALVGAAGSFDDIESVQILKGPQGTLYGRNATGGALVITTPTPEPGDELSVGAKATIGSVGVRRFSANISSGLGDLFAFRIAGETHNSDGFVENLSPGRQDQDDEDGFSLRGKLVFEPSANFSSVLSLTYSNDTPRRLAHQQVGQFDAGPIPGLNAPQAAYLGIASQFLGSPLVGLDFDPTDPVNNLAGALNFGALFGAAAGLTFPGQVGQTSDNQISSEAAGFFVPNRLGDISGGLSTESFRASLQLKFETDSFDVVSISAYSDEDTSISAGVLRADTASLPDLSAIPFSFNDGMGGVITQTIPLLAAFNQGNIGFTGVFPAESFAQDIYIVSNSGDFDWIVGGQYFNETGGSLIGANILGQNVLSALNDWETESFAIYAEGTYPLTDTLSFTGGLRYTDETYSLNDQIPAIFMGAPVGVPNVGNLSEGADQLTYTARLTYQNNDFLLYAGVNTGFKSGSLNPNNAIGGSASPEEITAYEAGFKTTIADGRIDLNGAGYYYDFSNIQVNVVEPSSGSNFIIDGVNARVYGAELDANARLTDNVTLFASGTWLDAKYTNNALLNVGGVPSIQPIDGNRLALSSELSLNGGFNVTVPVGAGALDFNGSVRFDSGFFIDQLNQFGSTGDTDGSFTVVNASIRYTDPSERITVSLWGNNIFDEDYFVSGVDAAGGLLQVADAGRRAHYGVTFGVQY